MTKEEFNERHPHYQKRMEGGHDWQSYEDSNEIDIFAYDNGYRCNGPVCRKCGRGACHHCNLDIYEEICRG